MHPDLDSLRQEIEALAAAGVLGDATVAPWTLEEGADVRLVVERHRGELSRRVEMHEVKIPSPFEFLLRFSSWGSPEEDFEVRVLCSRERALSLVRALIGEFVPRFECRQLTR